MGNQKNNLISGRVSEEVFIGLKKYGEALKLGRTNGACVLCSLGATIIFKILKQVDDELNLVWKKSMKDYAQIKDRFATRPQLQPLTSILKNKDIISSLPDEMMVEIFKIQNKK